MSVGPNGKYEYLIALCGRCGQVWAMDFEEETCTCGEYQPHPDDDIAVIEADDYHHALHLSPWPRP